MPVVSIGDLFYVDKLSIVLIGLVSFIGLIIASFSRRYMDGDTHARPFFLNLSVLLVSVIAMAASDHIVLFLGAWALSNGMLVRLMIHKSSWRAARASGYLAGQNFVLGFFCIASAVGIFYAITGQTSIQALVHHVDDSVSMTLALVLLLFGAMTQSALWPFHRWLLSSLNSPTPVSALMHAGVINGGGFLLARFGPLYLNVPIVLNFIVIVGAFTALLGTLWKLMQHDVKRMLACSTMGQMGFMFVQCGLGLFPAAVTHLCWHGMFKAYLFLASGGAAHEKKIDLSYPLSISSFLLALVCGAFGAYGFVMVNDHVWFEINTTLVVVAVVFVAGSQCALSILCTSPFKRLPVALMFVGSMGALYGGSVHLIDSLLVPLNFMQPQTLNFLHISVLVFLVLAWLFILAVRHLNVMSALPDWALCLYVKMLNRSQPHSATVTSHRKGYKHV